MKTRTLQMAVTEFAIPSPRSGHIEMYSGFGPLPEVGAEIHAAIQMERRRENAGFVPEKWISHTFEIGAHRVVVGGRMDGFTPGLPPRIEEIKSAYQAEKLLEALERLPDHPYRLQLLTYGYMHLKMTGQLADLRLHVVCARSGEAKDLHLILDVDAYEAWLARRLAEIVREDEMFEKLKRRRRQSAKGFVFPFPSPRAGQRELLETVEKELKNGARLLVQAPTGLGKTAAISFPVLQESMRRGQKTVYVTAKNTQHAVAEDAARQIQATGAKLKSVTVHAKSKMCLKDEVFCNPEHCEFARDYYTKVANGDLTQKLAKKKTLTAKTFRAFGRKHQVCPFEMQLEMVPRADLVIADYNYVFSPRNILGRLTNNGFGKSGQPNLVIDEAHNLPTRANDYYSARLSLEDLRKYSEGATPLDEETRDMMRGLVLATERRVRDLVPERDKPSELTIHPMDFMDLLGRSQEILGRYLGSTLQLQTQDPVLRFCNEFSAFAEALAGMGDEYFCTYQPGHAGGSLKVTCCDAANELKVAYAHFSTVVAFSATVKPFEYYAKILGFEGDGLKTAEFHSPFPKHNRKLLIIPQVSTKFRDRAANYAKIVAAIERIVKVKRGNYFVFFPSFDFLYQIAGRVHLPEFEVITQAREMRREAVEDILDKLRAREKPTLIMAVQGGVFAEGVDYPGDMLIGAIVVGPALPTFDFERELLRKYFDRKHGHGFDYAYTYPAMAKVVQSAGRVIRSPRDRGLIVLMDQRFTQPTYRQTMPADWLEDENPVSHTILHDIEKFWKSHEPENV